VLVVALAVSCASPRVKRRDPEAVLAPNPTLLGPRPTAEVAPAATEPAKVTGPAPAPLPSRPGEPPLARLVPGELEWCIDACGDV
jgi:hypothetical protein